MKRAGLLGAALGGYLLALRPRQLRWGATDEESKAPLTGDELIVAPDLVATRAITVRRPPVEVWPWVAQLGQGRAGFYTYDVLENLAGCNIHNANRIVPEWQHVRVGDPVCLHPEVPLQVALAEPNQALVLQGGVPMGGTPPPYDFTWAFVVREQADGTTRLVVRERYRYTRWWSWLLVEPVQMISFVMTEKMLRGIRDRAERSSRIPAPVKGGPADP